METKIINETFNNLKNQDKIIAKAFWSICQLENAFENEPERLKMLNSTTYSKKSDKALFNMFKKDKFSKLDKNQMLNLFQEVHNRTVKSQGYDPKYIVSMEKTNLTVMGYMMTKNNKLNINASLINLFKHFPGKSRNLPNSSTIGPLMLNTLLHETQHTIQMEKAKKFATKEYDNDKEKIEGAMSFMRLCIDEYMENSNDENLQNELQNCYNSDFEEHDANTKAVKDLKTLYQNGTIKDEIYADSSSMGLKFILGDLFYKNANITRWKFSNKAHSIQETTKFYMDIFNQKFKDCPIKNEVLDTLKDYVNGDLSDYKKDLIKDFDIFHELIFDKPKFTNKEKTNTENLQNSVC